MEATGGAAQFLVAKSNIHLMKKFLLPLMAFSLATGLTWLATAAPVRFEMPKETAAFKPGPGADLAKNQCLLCHSAEYVTIQPRLPRAFWEANVAKMRDKYGALVPKDQVPALVDYLVTNYGKP